jgi:DNA repair exonuclease SbcCD ATPase subunit
MIHARKIKLETTYAKCDIALPERGLVVVTGPNGIGKSSMVEGMGIALWGETLRGADPWDGEKGSAMAGVDTTAGAVTAERTRMAKGSKLSWSLGGADPVKYENTTKAQQALTQAVGEFDLWRRTHVFSAADSAHFTLATDGQRKRLLETILGLDKFDLALERCRLDKHKAETDGAEACSNLRHALSQIGTATEWLDTAKKQLEIIGEPPDVTALASRRTKLQAAVDGCQDELEQLNANLARSQHASGTHDAHAGEIERRLSTLAGDACDRCGQVIPETLRDRLRKAAHKEREAGELLRAEARVSNVAMIAQREDLQEELRMMLREQSAINQMVAVADGVVKQLAGARELMAKAEKSMADALEAKDVAVANTDEASARVHVLKAIENVLGLKGVRAHILGRALAGVGDVANAWLARLSGGVIKLRLEERGDALALEVDVGGGKWQPYRAASGGQRRRVDVALLMALSEVSAAAAGQSPGTLWFDEVFDALDGDGVRAICDALPDLAADRAVVVITHNAALAAGLPAAMRWSPP